MVVDTGFPALRDVCPQVMVAQDGAISMSLTALRDRAAGGNGRGKAPEPVLLAPLTSEL